MNELQKYFCHFGAICYQTVDNKLIVKEIEEEEVKKMCSIYKLSYKKEDNLYIIS